MSELVFRLLKHADDGDGKVNANKFQLLTKEKDSDINNLKIQCCNYGSFSKGFGDLTWCDFILNENGRKYIKNRLNEQTKQSEAQTAQQNEQKNFKVFISYSYDDEQHEQWVENFAKRLHECNIDVILDKWHLRLVVKMQT